jgi:hypothetical protein
MAQVGKFLMSGIAAALLSGCSGGSSGGIMTGSLFGTSKPADAKPADPLGEPVAVGWTSARAVKCGFYFSPQKLRAQYLTAKVTAGTPPDQMVRVEQAYDRSYAEITAALAKRPDYCTKPEVENIRGDLNRHLAGDYSGGKKDEKKELSTLEWLKANAGDGKPKPIFLDPTDGSPRN